ncbi:MAG: hypothetical protein M3294_07000 [Pseudomonadota bacterium]|nr:hypothetical protein [Pseudomonadota bacterium]
MQAKGLLTHEPSAQRRGLSGEQGRMGVHLVGLVTQSPFSHLNGLVRGHTVRFNGAPKASAGSSTVRNDC